MVAGAVQAPVAAVAATAPHIDIFLSMIFFAPLLANDGASSGSSSGSDRDNADKKEVKLKSKKAAEKQKGSKLNQAPPRSVLSNDMARLMRMEDLFDLILVCADVSTAHTRTHNSHIQTDTDKRSATVHEAPPAVWCRMTWRCRYA